MPLAVQAQVPGELVPGRQYQEDQPQIPAVKVLPPTEIGRPSALQEAPEGSEDIKFLLRDLVFDGVTVFNAETLKQQTAAKYLGQTISIADLYDIAAQVTGIYGNAGYLLSFAFVPEQSIKDGTVRIHVVEGFVDKVQFRDESGGEALEKMNERLRDSLPGFTKKIIASNPLKSDALQRVVFLLNDIPGMTAKAVFNASADVKNASTLTFYVSYKRIQAQASFDNHLSKSFDYYSYGGTATLNGALTGKDTLQISARCGLSCGTYNQQSLLWNTYLGGDGLKLELSGQHSGTSPSNGVLSNLDFVGMEKSFSIGLDYPVLRAQDKNVRLGMSMGWLNSETETFAGTLTADTISTFNTYASFDFADWTGASTYLNLGIAEGLPFFGYTKDGDALKSRANGSATFTNFTAAISRMQPLGFIFPGADKLSVLASANAQYAGDDPLLSSSQCYYGSTSVGRGYNSGAIGGDHCAMGMVELRYDTALGGNFVQFYGFGDAGSVWRKGDLLAGEDRKETAKSLGGGLRFSTSQHIEGDVELAFPLDEDKTANGKGTPKLRFSMTWRY